ncbi:type I-C CRISPR-associated protein Cas8c/Csd1 [Psychrobacter sp. TAE2020]|uniref:type I-C CRISPR-associated protein Cas8c/Csd1 n=1 Tax=Psychrobacter sp. TAE2020 TaxID=2846762 RepID=UPI001C11A1EA|nr:type I-C CRISPR-associated protein Cas8c/Csd1 [Psychrobacter sp. TAE2020]MBU5617731.1 type I-C CRISPR-associated protein Cas8c/Csd1 [Psychrobacter sp. TAE2020]
MSWLQRLYQTYELASQNEEIQAQESSLMPYYHVNQNVQIIVTINDKGDFVNAEVCRDGNGKVKSSYLVIPATNDSANRTSGAVAHPLSDKLQYIGKDFHEYSDGNKKDLYPLYEQELSTWCHSEYAHPKAQAVLNYVQKGTLVKDLLDANVLIADPDDISKLAYPEQASDYPDSLLSSLNKNKGVFDQGAAFIAWRVAATELGKQAEHGVSETWRDESLFESWQQFYATLDSLDGFCYITGKDSPLASKHPNRILRSATNAKLISANDLSSFTFLGRFTDDEKSIKAHGLQGANISAVVTEKAHAALSWLLSRQGREDAGQAVVAWAISGKETLQPTQEINEDEPFDVEEIVESVDLKEEEINPFTMSDDDDFDDGLDKTDDDSEYSEIDATKVNENKPNKLNHSNNLGQTFATHLNNTMRGYRQQLDVHDQISIITLDAATPGRMAVTYYHETMSNDYIDALACWYQQFSWYATYKDSETNEYKLIIKSPIPKLIAEVAYGSRVSDALKKQVVSQVLPCIVEGEARHFPWQLVDLCIKRACNPLTLEHRDWEQALSVACALYRGYYLRQSDNKKRSYTVALQTEHNSRDYLYGRLLAVAEDIESLALYIAGEKRNTTAQRYMQQFANRPFTTWRNIELALKPYENRLKSSRAGYLANMQDLLDQIMSHFEVECFNNDSALSGEFLLGYHSQKMQIKLDKQQAKKAREDKKHLEETSKTA